MARVEVSWLIRISRALCARARYGRFELIRSENAQTQIHSKNRARLSKDLVVIRPLVVRSYDPGTASAVFGNLSLIANELNVFLDCSGDEILIDSAPIVCYKTILIDAASA